jgi:four helix bundle protein
VKNSPLKDKSYQFAIEIVNIVEVLHNKNNEYVLSKQLLRSGTAIGALISESEFAQSQLDFINKLSVSLKEANETLYWLSLLKDTNYIDVANYNDKAFKVKELIKMLVSSINTVKNKIQ